MELRVTAPARPLLLKIPAAARELSIGHTKLYELQRIRLGGNATRIPYSELEAYVARKLAEQAD
jgi:hypothetical protein